MSDSSKPVIYQLKVVLLGISPMIWRRLKVSSDSTIEDLHYTLQIAMGWEDIHLHHFIIYGKQYGITQPGGIIFSDRGGSDAQAFWRLLSVASPLLVTSILWNAALNSSVFLVTLTSQEVLRGKLMLRKRFAKIVCAESNLILSGCRILVGIRPVT
jgi:hypothetical protein